MKRFASVIKCQSLYLLSAMIINILMFQEGLSGTDGITLQTFSGQPLNSSFGQSVASAGDVNGDGNDDLIIGANYSGEGRAYIFFGGATVDTIPDVTLNYRMSNDRFGECVAGAGDVNNDGYADVVVGARLSGQLGTDSGHVYIYFGSAVMDSTPDVIMAGLPSELFGRSVASAGDVNNDTYADVIVGAYGSDAAGLDVGRAYIFFGGATVDNIPDVIITGTVITEDLGYSVASAGDINNDGYDDVIVGAYTNDLAAGNNSGKAYLYMGGSSMDNVVDVTFNGSAAFDYFGVCVAGAGDVNNDGYDDVLISSRGNNVKGRVSLYLGGSVMNNIADVTIDGEAIINYFGESAASAGDINGDGYADVIIGAFGNNSSTGKAYIYYGGASMDTIPDLTFIGEAAGDRFGGSVVFRVFALPYETKVVESSHSLGLPYTLHICGDASGIIDDMIDTGSDGLELDYRTDAVLACDKMKERTVFVGSIDPSGVLALGTPQHVEEKTRELLNVFADTQRFILNAGCAIPSITPSENLRAMISTARSF